MRIRNVLVSLVVAASVVLPAAAQDMLPADNGLATYHTSPRYRESESHPLRIVAYVLHPVGWVLREVIFRPFSYFASSTEVTRSVLGYREPFDYRQPECFSADDSVPDCRSVVPFNYDPSQDDSSASSVVGTSSPDVVAVGGKEVYLENVNFDFNKRTLNDLGKGRVKQVAELLKKDGNVKVVLQGHTDYKGTEAYNLKLGMDRAEAVRSELVALGVGAERLSTVTFGESQPLFAEQEDWARALNRRVEVHPGDVAAAPAH